MSACAFFSSAAYNHCPDALEALFYLPKYEDGTAQTMLYNVGMPIGHRILSTRDGRIIYLRAASRRATCWS